MDNSEFSTDSLFFKHVASMEHRQKSFPLHIHDKYELIYFRDGNATHVIEDRQYKLKKGDLILVRPFQYHFIQIDETARYERYDILFDATRHQIDGLDLLPEGMDVLNIEDNKLAQDVFRKCDLYYQSCYEKLFGQALYHLLSELFISIHLFSHSSSGRVVEFSPLISRGLQYINENLCQIQDISEITKQLYISDSYFFRLFKKELHCTPKRYICEKRLLLAHKLLSSGKKPADIFEQCGFQDYSTFYRNYVSFFGHSPKSAVKNSQG